MCEESELSFSELSHQEQYEMCMKAADEVLRVIMSMTLKECTQIDLGQVLIYYQWSNDDDTTEDDLRNHLEEYDRSGRIWDYEENEYRQIKDSEIIEEYADRPKTLTADQAMSMLLEAVGLSD